MMTKDTAYHTITELVQRFYEQKDSYKKADYNETLVQRDFIDPFFKALGSDIDNAQGYAWQHKWQSKADHYHAICIYGS